MVDAGECVAPSRGRGSKLDMARATENVGGSPPHGGVDRNYHSQPPYPTHTVAPSRGRGSKRDIAAEHGDALASPPHGGVDRNTCRTWRSLCLLTSPPHGGVDRNTSASIHHGLSPGRPLTGAWIETHGRRSHARRSHVAPSRGRGSKRLRNDGERRGQARVAPSRGRGSKHHLVFTVRADAVVAPSRGRGSKHRGCACPPHARDSRPLTGAWIETAAYAIDAIRPAVAPSRGRGSKLD